MDFVLSLNALAGNVYSFAADSDDDGSGIAFLFLTLGFVFYAVQWARYRNADKRHQHETETKAAKVSEEKVDEFLYSEKGLRNSSMKGSNHRRVSGSVKGMSDWFT